MTDNKTTVASSWATLTDRITELEAQLEAVGAGGVGALISNAERKGAATLEPFGYFKSEPFGWTDCAETDEGAIALYEAPQPQQIAEPAAVVRKPLNAAERRSPPLTAEQIDEIHLTNSDAYERGDVDYESHGFARAIEAAHGITVEQGGA